MRTDDESHSALRALVGAQLDSARAAWPTISIEPRAFIDYVVARIPAAPEAEQALLARHLPDLYLACGCALGDAAALAALEARFLSEVRAFVSRIETSPDFVDEVRQGLREHLFVGRGDRAPAIADYSGRGPLSNWLRVSAQRIALNLRRGRKPQSSWPRTIRSPQEIRSSTSSVSTRKGSSPKRCAPRWPPWRCTSATSSGSTSSTG